MSRVVDGFVLRTQIRKASCRGCGNVIQPEEVAVYTYTNVNRGMSIFICLKCAGEIGNLCSLSKDGVEVE